ncbi:ATP-binding protein [Marinobacter pelagius]|uniref:ATP-binding protein n=1 Tax=Marinobacter sp. C7 TaxID=2951363 RepID=UPI001EF14468|nr:ATP-binding protein [Marinobacter sp. C7]MCG7198106.1 ATP-binding protein [Marinobacter sp. C7]
MSLKRQLLVASLLMLLIPWAGLKFVLELDTALREQAIRQLDSRAGQLAELAGDRLLGEPAIPGDTPVIYVAPLTQPFTADGYGSEWPGYDDTVASQPWQDTRIENGLQLQWQAASDGQYLYLLIRLSGRQSRFFSPAASGQPHDYLKLWLQAPATAVDQQTARQAWLIRPSAPGELYGQTDTKEPRPDYRLKGAWQEHGRGWQLELQLPQPPDNSRLGFAAYRYEGATLATSLEPLPILVGRRPALERRLLQQLDPGQQARIVEPAGWVIAEAQKRGSDASPEFDSLSPVQVLEQVSLNVLRYLIQLYQPEPGVLPDRARQLDTSSLPEQGLFRHPDDSRWLLVTKPVFGDRSLVLEQSLDQLLTLSGSTLGSVIARSTLIIVALTLVLLGYASWLSWRIARLQRLVSNTVDEDGRITGTLPASTNRDELGQLQAHFAQMVERLHGYNRYLESFSRRLSHELKTPVAIVRSSLENLAHAESEDDRQQYLERASVATERLRQILHGMSEAARLEQSFDQADKEPFDLAEVAAQATAAYQALDSRHEIRYTGPDHGCPLTGSPEHLVQLLDKLVDNARDFTPEQGLIEVSLDQQPEHVELSVFNQGSALPETGSADIFGAFVSHRDGNGEGHLGQGLLIVRLIAEYHGGRVEAANEAHGGIDGVRFRVIIPVKPR